MKLPPLIPMFFAAAFFAAGPLTRAEDHGHPDNPPGAGDGHPAGPGPHDGPGDGDHEHHHGLALNATAHAPAGAEGLAQLDFSDPSSPALAVGVRHLVPGTYTVSLTTTTHATLIGLGTLEVLSTTPANEPTTGVLALPSGLDLSAVASIQVASDSGTVLLSSNHQEHHDPDGGEHHGLRLTATADAPTGAVGEVRLDLAMPTSPALAFEVHNLAAGTYTVNLTTTAGATPIAAGSFDVLDTTAAGTPTTASVPLPADLDPKTIASVQVADAHGIVLLSGTHQEPSEPEHAAEFRLHATADAPADSRGEAQFDTSVADAPALALETRGLAAGTYTVQVVSIATAAVTAIGTFDVTADAAETSASLGLPAGVLPTDIASVQVLDSTGLLLLAGDGACHGGDVTGAEHLHQEIMLTATADAPTGLAGHAELEAEDHDGASAAILALGVKGLAAGDYSVSVTSQATGTTTLLGTLTSAGSGKDHIAFGTADGTAFPAGFNPLDIAGLVVADAHGVTLLNGSFATTTTTTKASFVARVKTVPGVAAPKSTGSAVVVARTTKKVHTQKFALVAKGAPAKATLTMKINGVVAGQVKTNRRGGLAVSRLPKGTQAQKITSVTLETSAGARVLGAFF